GIDWNLSYTHDLNSRFSYGVSAGNGNGYVERSCRFDAIQIFKLKPYQIVFAEYRPRKDINIRFEIQNATSRGLRLTRYSFSPTRAAGGVPDVDDRDLQFGRLYYVRIRKTFGG